MFGINLVSDDFSKFYLHNGGAKGSDKKREAILLGKMNLALRRKQDPQMAFFTLGLADFLKTCLKGLRAEFFA